MRILCLIILFFSLKSYSQSLSISETIDYLNQLSREHPGHYFENLENQFDYCESEVIYIISFDFKSKISIQEKINRKGCKTISKNKIVNGNIISFDLYDFNIDDIEYRTIKYTHDVVLKGDITLTSFDTSQNTYSQKNKKVDDAYLAVEDTRYLKIFFNGIKYLISLAKEKIEKVKDPFSNKISIQKDKIITSSNIPLVEKNGVATLNVTIGSKILSKFILDTGAGECNISSELEKNLIENSIIKEVDYLENGLYKLADGTIVENKRVKLPKIKIGNTTIFNIIASIGPSDSPNLLGQSFLKKLRKWTIDNSKKLLIVN